MADATKAEAARWLRKLRRIAELDTLACLADLPTLLDPAVHGSAKRALRRAGFYRRKRVAARVKAIDRAIATLEASDV